MRTSHAEHEFPSVGAARSGPVSVVPRAICRNTMPPAVFKLAVICWAMLLAVFWVTFSVSANALFMVVIGTGYAIIFFGVPFIMIRMAPPQNTGEVSLGTFLKGRFDTIYGPVSGFDAMLQVILVPLALSIGGVVIGFIIHSARIAN